MTEEYKCKETGLSDINFTEFSELTAIVNSSNTAKFENIVRESLNSFSRAGYGRTFEKVRSYIEEHVKTCEPCRSLYISEMQKPERMKEIYSAIAEYSDIKKNI